MIVWAYPLYALVGVTLLYVLFGSGRDTSRAEALVILIIGTSFWPFVLFCAGCSYFSQELWPGIKEWLNKPLWGRNDNN